MAAAAALSRRGYSVHLYNRTHERIAAILEQGGVAIEGDLVGGDQAEELVPLALITTDVAAAMENIDLILIAVPAYGQKAMLEACLPYLRSGQIILLLTGSAAPRSPKALRPAVFNTRSVPAERITRVARRGQQRLWRPLIHPPAACTMAGTSPHHQGTNGRCG